MRYEEALLRLVREMTEATRKEVERLFESETGTAYFATDASIGSQARILTNRLNKRFSELFRVRSKPMAERMVKQTDAASTTALHTSLKQMSGGLSLKTSTITAPMEQVLAASVAENVALIRSIPAQYLLQIQGAVMRSITTGQGLKDLIPAIDKHADEVKNRAKNIALDQTRKAYNNLNRDRMQALGVKRFEWIHSGGGQKPRPLHIELSGRIFRFDDLPVIDERTGERGIPGQAINCRCTMRPVIEFEEGPEYANT